MTIDAYIKLAISLVAATSILYIPILFILMRKGKKIIRQFSYLALFYSVLSVIFITIILFNIPFDFKPEKYVLNSQPLQWLWNGNIKKRIISEIIPNIIIFIPLGFFIPMVFEKLRKIYKAALVIFLVTFTIEFFQYFIGRKSDIDDCFANLVGGLIGYGIFAALNYICKNQKWWNLLIGKDS